MKNKKLLYIFSALGLSVISFYSYNYLKKSRAKNSSGLKIIEDIEFTNSNGAGSVYGDILHSQRQRVYMSVMQSKNEIEKATPNEYKKFLGRKIYTLEDKVNIRNGNNINNGVFNNISGTIPKKKSFIGKVTLAEKGKDGYLWFGINEKNSNSYLSKYFNWNISKNPDDSIKWVRSDVVVIEPMKKK